MQSLKCWLAVGVAVCALSVRGEDTDAQAKAREALEKKLNELQGQPAAPPTPTQPAPAKPTPAKTPPPPKTTAVPSSTFTAPPSSDPAAIEKARSAMREKMSTLQPAATEVPAPAPAPKITVQPPPEPAPAAAPPPAPVNPPPPVPAPPPVAAPAAAVATSSVVSSPPAPAPAAMPDLPPPSDPDAIAKAREALRQKMNELQAGQSTPAAQPSPAPPAAPAVPAPAVPPAPPAAVSAATIQPPSTPDLTAPPEADPAAIAKAREAMRLKMQTIGPEPVAANEMVSMHSRRVSQNGMSFPPLSAPPLGISAAKEQRLQELLQQYRSDLISPEQYQASRAKILAEP